MKKILSVFLLGLPIMASAQGFEPYQPKYIGADGKKPMTIEEKRKSLMEKQPVGSAVNSINSATGSNINKNSFFEGPIDEQTPNTNSESKNIGTEMEKAKKAILQKSQ